MISLSSTGQLGRWSSNPNKQKGNLHFIAPAMAALIITVEGSKSDTFVKGDIIGWRERKIKLSAKGNVHEQLKKDNSLC